MTTHRMTVRLESNPALPTDRQYVLDVHDFPRAGETERCAMNCLTRERAERLAAKPLGVREIQEPPYEMSAYTRLAGALRAASHVDTYCS